LDDGDAAGAADLLVRLLRRLPSSNDLDRAPVLALLVRAHVARRALDEAAFTLDALRAIEAQTPILRAGVDLAAGALAAAAGEHDRGRVLLEDAVDGFERCGAPFETALARSELARCLRSLGRIEAAEREAAAAHQAFVTIGALAEAERTGRQLAVEQAATPLPQLTRREREVMRLLATGMTNRRIAAQLVVSEHTVHRHVTSILRKLDVTTRTAAAAEAVRSGLLESASN
jgi:DNA-binding CsgD family transcriptional regulator